MTADWQETAFETRAIHAGQEPDPTTGAITTPIYQTSTFVQKGIDELGAYEYGRTHNPTRTALQEVVASLEGAAWGLAYASGLAGTQNISYLLAPGDHIVLTDDAYGGTHRFVAKVISRYGIDYTLVDMSDLEQVRAAIRPETRLIWAETPTNPYLKIVDIRGRGRSRFEITRRCWWSTTPSPRRICRTRWRSEPISSCTPAPSTSAATPTWSAVSWSATIRRSTRRSSSTRTRAARCRGRSTAGSCCAASRRCRCGWSGTAAMGSPSRSSCANIRPCVRSSTRACPTIPVTTIAARQMRDFSGMVSFTVRGDFQTAAEVARSTRIFQLAVSLGGVCPSYRFGGQRSDFIGLFGGYRGAPRPAWPRRDGTTH